MELGRFQTKTKQSLAKGAQRIETVRHFGFLPVGKEPPRPRAVLRRISKFVSRSRAYKVWEIDTQKW